MAAPSIQKKCRCGRLIVEKTSTTFEHPNIRQLMCEDHFEGSAHFHKWVGGHTCNAGCLAKQDRGHELEWNGKKRYTANDFKQCETENNLLKNDMNTLMETVEGLQLTNTDLTQQLEHYQRKCKDLTTANKQLRISLQKSEHRPIYGVPIKIIVLAFILIICDVICFNKIN